jgi:hypothetical protein
VATTLPERRRQMKAYIDWEQNARQIVEVAPLLVPGVLQTREYIHAIMTAGGVPGSEITDRIITRVGRNDIIARKQQPGNLLALIGVAALHQDIGGRETTYDQILHLLKESARPNVDLRIVPDRVGFHPGLEGAFTLIDSDRAVPLRHDGRRRGPAEVSSIASVETRRSILMLHEQADVGSYRRAAEWVLDVALTPDASANYLAELAKRLESR